MKLIIDIDKEQYEPIKEHKGGFYIGIFNNIRNGIPFEEELEKIKQEIGRIETEEGGDFLEKPAIDIIYESQKILDKHISELKGEQE